MGKARKERLELSAKNFRYIGTAVPGKVLLIDDVKTTGATLAAASKVLKKAGVKHVYAAVFTAA